MRSLLFFLATLALAAPTLAQQEPGGISSSALSRCAGKVGLDTRQSDAAFGLIMLDGMPWVSIERTEEKMGSQMVATTVTGTGALGRHKGTTVYFRFTCLLDDKGEAVMFHSRMIDPALGDFLPPARTVAGSATYLARMALPRGAELRVQLLDVTKSADRDILAEQVVRSGWEVPIPFALRLPRDSKLAGRKLVLTAQLVAERRVLFRLSEPRALGVDDVDKRLDLVLDPAPAAKR